MTKEEWKKILPYGGLPVLGAAFWALRRGAEPAALLLGGVLLAFGYLAALGDLREKRISNRLVGAMLCAWIVILVPQLFYRTDYALWLLMNGGAGFLLAAVCSSFGGLSILCQTAAALDSSGLSLKPCILGKCLQATFAAVLCGMLFLVDTFLIP